MVNRVGGQATHGKGAQDMATTVTDDRKHRILRLGIIKAGKIIEERLLWKQENITIGQSPRNTFVLPGPGLPKTYTIFEVRAGKYFLVFNAVMEGRVSAGEEIIDLKGLSRSGEAVKRGSQYVLELTGRSRGKIVIGDVTLLFQFVEAPLAGPIWQARVGERVDWGFLYLVTTLTILIGGTAVGSHIWWLVTGQYLQSDLQASIRREYEFMKAEVKIKKKKEEEEKPPEVAKPTEEVKVDAPPEEKVEAAVEKKPVPKASPTQSAADRVTKSRKEVAARVTKRTFLSVLGTTEGTGESVAASLAKGAGSQQLSSAFEGVGVDFKASTPGFESAPEVKISSTGTYKRLDPTETTGRITTKTVTPTATKNETDEVKIRLNISGQTTGQTGTGKIDKAGVSGVFSRRVGAIKHCYEVALKSNPNAKGKIQVRFTIGSGGRITGATVASNTTGDSSIGNCIIEKLRSWKFPPAEGGEVTFTHTFVLSAG
jgi:outer membrane biosynthesis protein TonB